MKLAICAPTSGSVRIEWVESLIEVVKASLRDPYNKIKDVKLFFYTSSVIPANRNHVANHALNWGATHLLFIDDDMRFPKEVFKAIWKQRNLPIIAANCCRRMYPISFMAKDFLNKDIDSRGKTGTEVVLSTGFSFVLIQAKVFKETPKPWTAFPYHPQTDDYGTEDYFFFERAAAAGFPCVIDHDISQLIHHVGVHEFDPLSERGAYTDHEREETNDSPD